MTCAYPDVRVKSLLVFGEFKSSLLDVLAQLVSVMMITIYHNYNIINILPHID